MRKIEGEYDTAAHGDFHSGNIFGLSESRSYRPSANWSFSLIDCAGLTFRGIHPLMDPLYFMYRTGYSLFRDGNSTRSLFNLTKSFYAGYLGHLPPDINRTLQALPDWRKVASTELTKTKNLVFLSSDPTSAAFLSRFDPLHADAVKSVFTDLGYDLVVPKSFTGQSPAALTPCCLGAAVATPRAPTPAVVILPQDDCPECAKLALTPVAAVVVAPPRLEDRLVYTPRPATAAPTRKKGTIRELAKAIFHQATKPAL